MNDLEIFKNTPEGATPQEIAEYLDNACQGDLELRSRVEALFKAERSLGNQFLNDVPIDLNSTLSDDEAQLPQSSEKKEHILGVINYWSVWAKAVSGPCGPLSSANPFDAG
jgi:hypothetical protein